MRHLVDVAGLGLRVGLQGVQLFIVVAQLRCELLLAGTEAIEAGNDTVALFIEHTEQSGEQLQQPCLLLIAGLCGESLNLFLGLPDRHTALRCLLHEICDLLVLLPVRLILTQRGA